MTVNELIEKYGNPETFTSAHARELEIIMKTSPDWHLRQYVRDIGKVPFVSRFALDELKIRQRRESIRLHSL